MRDRDPRVPDLCEVIEESRLVVAGRDGFVIDGLYYDAMVEPRIRLNQMLEGQGRPTVAISDDDARAVLHGRYLDLLAG